MCMFLREREREKWGHNGGEVYYCVLITKEDRQKKNETMNCVFLRVGGERERL